MATFVCTSCLHMDERQFDHCPACSAQARAKLSRDNVLLEIPTTAGMPCQICLETGRHLRFRRYRRVVAFVVGVSLQDIAGYFCPRCRLNTFLARQGATLLTGWWGVLALIAYNPFAILLNFYGLLAAPLAARDLGAIDLDDVRSAAAEHEDFEELYSSLPTWLTGLDEHEIELVLRKTDYYAVLAVSADAPDAEIKAAFRRQAKAYHPDSGRAEASSERMVEINQAYEVLSDARLRYAYDHASEISFEAHADEHEDSSGSRLLVLSCRYCGVQVHDLDDGVGHLERFHPELDVINPWSAFERAEANV